MVGADKVAETRDAQFILNLIWDPFFERDFALNTVTMAAIQAVRHMEQYGSTEEQMAEVAVRSWRRAKRNPRAHLRGDISVAQVLESPLMSWPLKRYDCCPRSSGAAAVVIASERMIRERGLDAAWINGAGALANTVFMGDRLGPRRLTDMGDYLRGRQRWVGLAVLIYSFGPIPSNQLFMPAGLALLPRLHTEQRVVDAHVMILNAMTSRPRSAVLGSGC